MMVNKKSYDEILDTLAKQVQKSNCLQNLHEQLLEDLNHSVTYGAELEFYLPQGFSVPKQICGYDLKDEKGEGQYEICFTPNSSPQELAAEIEGFKSEAQHAIFDSKPYVDDYGSAMHIHLNVGERNLDRVATILCEYLLPTFLVFAPTAKDYSRFDKEYMAPTHVSYGNNNRTCSLRVPASTPKRLEHRVAGSNANAFLVLYCLLYPMALVYKNDLQIPAQTKIYGNAFDNQYHLPLLPSSREEAIKAWDYALYENVN